MRVTTIFLLFAVVIFCTRGDEEDEPDEPDESDSNSENDDSSQENIIKPDCEQYKQQTCPKNGKPVCGSNNKKYDSECELCLENRKKKTNVEILKDKDC